MLTNKPTVPLAADKALLRGAKRAGFKIDMNDRPTKHAFERMRGDGSSGALSRMLADKLKVQSKTISELRRRLRAVGRLSSAETLASAFIEAGMRDRKTTNMQLRRSTENQVRILVFAELVKMP